MIWIQKKRYSFVCATIIKYLRTRYVFICLEIGIVFLMFPILCQSGSSNIDDTINNLGTHVFRKHVVQVQIARSMVSS